MRSTRKKMLPALLAVLALSAVAASAAQAATAEGPFYKITGSRLAEGKTQEVKAKAGGTITLYTAGGYPVSLGCSNQIFTPKSKLLGSTGANFGSGEVSIEYSGCRLEDGNGAPDCHLAETEGGKETTIIKTEPLKLELAYTSSTRSGDIAAVLTPVAGASRTFTTIYFGGAGCEIFGSKMTGQTAADIETSPGEAPVVVGSEPKATKKLDLTWPTTKITEVWLESNGTLKRSTIEMDFFGDAVKVSDKAELELTGGAEWGVFT